MVLASLIAGSNHYLANQRADVFAGLPVGLRLGQRFGETDHPCAIVFSDIRMYVRQIGRGLGEPGLDLDFLLLQLSHSCLHGWPVHTIFDGVENPFDTSLSLLKGAAARFCLRSLFMVLAIGLHRISAHRDRDGLGGYQLVGEARQHAPLDIDPTNGTTVVAYPLAEMTETAVAVVDDDAVFAATTPADQQS